MNRNKIGVNADYFNPGMNPPRKELKLRLRTIKRLGFDGVMITGWHENFVRPNVKEIRDIVESEGLIVFQVHCPFPNLADPQPDRWYEAVGVHKRWIEYALKLKAETMITHLGGWKNIYDPREKKRAKEVNVRSVKELAKEVRGTDLLFTMENTGISVLLHPDNGQGYGFYLQDLVEVIEEVGGRNLGICFDTTHAMVNMLNLKKEILDCRKYLVTTHLVDTRVLPEIYHLMPGQGIIDFQEVRVALERINFKGSLVLEVMPQRGSRALKSWKDKVKLLEEGRDFLKKTFFRQNL